MFFLPSSRRIYTRVGLVRIYAQMIAAHVFHCTKLMQRQVHTVAMHYIIVYDAILDFGQ